MGRSTLPTVKAGRHRRMTALQKMAILGMFAQKAHLAGNGAVGFELLVEAEGPRKTTGNFTTGMIRTTRLLRASTACRTGSMVEPVFNNGILITIWLLQCLQPVHQQLHTRSCPARNSRQFRMSIDAPTGTGRTGQFRSKIGFLHRAGCSSAPGSRALVRQTAKSKRMREQFIQFWIIIVWTKHKLFGQSCMDQPLRQ